MVAVDLEEGTVGGWEGEMGEGWKGGRAGGLEGDWEEGQEGADWAEAREEGWAVVKEVD